MRKYRLQRIDPLDVGFICGLMAIVFFGIAGVLACVGGLLGGYGWDPVLLMPLIVGVVALKSMFGGFIFALVFNVASYYMGGITVTLREADRWHGGQTGNEPPTIGTLRAE